MSSRHSIPVRFGNWRMDGDGFMRVTAHVLKEGVFPYSAEETFGEGPVPDVLPDVEPVMQYIPLAEFTEAALDSLEGKPVTVPLLKPGQEWHQWRNPANALKDCLTVGVIAGRPCVTGNGEIEADMLIMDAPTISDIQAGKLVEVSAGYHGLFNIGEGRFGDAPYHGAQTKLEFNHVLLLPEGAGRCGYDVRIINSRGSAPANHEEVETMPMTLKVTVGNKARSYKFQNEDDAAQAESMLNEEQNFNAEAVQSAIAARKGLEEQIAALQTQLAENNKSLQDAKAQIEKLLSMESQEAMAQEVFEQKEAEGDIIEAETDNAGEAAGPDDDAKKKKEGFANALKNCKGLAERRRVLVGTVMNKRGLKTEGWTQDAYDGAFEMLAANAKGQTKAKTDNGRVLNGTRAAVQNGGSGHINNRDRMLRPMKTRNAKPEGK